MFRAAGAAAPLWGAVATIFAVAAVTNRDRLNVDAIAYLRLAGYYADGRLDLALSGYWGPLLSWLLAPLLAAGVEPLLAGRLVMALSGVLFVAASASFYRALGLARGARVAALVVTVPYVLIRSVEQITPDLLLAACLVFVFARVLAPPTRRAVVQAGLAAGVAALSKPVGLPAACVGAGALALVLRCADGVAWRPLLRSGALFLLLALALFAPWFVALGVAEGWDAFGRSARVNRALAGPQARLRPDHPGGGHVQDPPPGRVTVWEDPPGNGYGTWSALEDPAHQLWSLENNGRVVLAHLLAFDLLHLALMAAVAALLFCKPWRLRLRRERWRRAVLPGLAAAALFLPFYADSARYYFPAYPCVVAGALGLAWWLGRRWLRWLMLASLVAHPLSGAFPVLQGEPDPVVRDARALAAHMRAEDLVGPIAGDHTETLYVAYFLGQPWLGQAGRHADADRIRGHGSRFVVVHAAGPAAFALHDAPDFRPHGRVGGFELFEREP